MDTGNMFPGTEYPARFFVFGNRTESGTGLRILNPDLWSDNQQPGPGYCYHGRVAISCVLRSAQWSRSRHVFT